MPFKKLSNLESRFMVSGRSRMDPNSGRLEVRALEYSADGEGTLHLEGVQSLTRDEVDQTCRRFGEVQDMVNETTRRLKNGNTDLSAPVLGTKIHKDIERQINDLHEGDFAAERSRIKGRGQSYGVPGTVRIDALELSNANTVCVYDIKTGRSRLSFGRMLELGSEAQTAFGEGLKRIIVVEVTPMS